MSAIRRSPAIPLSPSSPPESGLKQRSKRRLSEDAPNSPATPPLMSIALKSYGTSHQNAHSSGEHTSQTSPASPASSSVFTQHSTQPVNQSSSTPGSSAFDVSRGGSIEDQHRDKRQKMEMSGDHSTGGGSEILPTNHDRQQNEHGSESASGLLDQSGQFEPNSTNAGESGTCTEDSSLEKLRKDMGDAFLLSKSTISRSRLDPKTHLMSRFGLGPLLSKVARTDPVTGEKVNKLRKSYEGQVKLFAIAGRNKVARTEALENGKRPLRSMVEDIPEEEWEEKHGRTPVDVTPEFKSDFKAKLQKALQLQPGTVRNNAIWEDRLGHEKSRPGMPGPAGPAVADPFTAAPVRQTNGTSRTHAPALPNAIRPRRTGKKRSYADDSFEGYGEGFGDDDGEFDDGAFDDDDEGGGSARKKRKKEHSFSISPTSYGGGYTHGR